MAMDTANDIKGLIESLAIRPTELAVKCGVTDDTVRKWLRGDRKPSGSAKIILEMLLGKATRRPAGAV